MKRYDVNPQLLIDAPRAEPLPVRSERDMRIDDTTMRMVKAQSIEVKLHYARKLAELKRAPAQ